MNGQRTADTTLRTDLRTPGRTRIDGQKSPNFSGELAVLENEASGQIIFHSLF